MFSYCQEQVDETSEDVFNFVKLNIILILCPDFSLGCVLFSCPLVVFIEYVMDNLKDNFDPLVSLVVYEYTHFRGFSFEGVVIELLKSRALGSSEGDGNGTEGGGDQQDESNDEARRLLLESQRQLMALRAREGNDESDQIESRMNPLRDESKQDEVADDAMMKLSRRSADGERSLEFYDNMIIDVLYRFSDASIKAPYFGRFLFEVPFLTTRVISFLRQYCSLPDNAEYGFEVVRNLIELKQTQWREELLNLLFGFSAYEDQTVQKAAIKAACQLAHSSSKWEEIVEVSFDTSSTYIQMSNLVRFIPFTIS